MNSKNLYVPPYVAGIKLDTPDYENPFLLAETQFFFDHTKFLCDGDEACYEWIIKYLAHMFKYPHVVPKVMLVLHSAKQGTGKSLWVNLLAEMIGSAHAIVTSSVESVLGRFNGLIAGKLLTSVEECKISTAEQHRALKAMITGEMITIERKGLDQESHLSFARLIVTTNDDNSMKFGDNEKDRRTMVVSCSSGDVGTEYGARLANLRSRKIMRLIYERLMSIPVNIGYDFSKNRPHTEIQEEMIEASRSPELESLFCSLDRLVSTGSVKVGEDGDRPEVDPCIMGPLGSYIPVGNNVSNFMPKQKIAKGVTVNIPLVDFYVSYKKYIEDFCPSLKTYCMGSKAFQAKVKHWLEYKRDSKFHHGVKYYQKGGEITELRFLMEEFVPWYRSRRESKS